MEREREALLRLLYLCALLPFALPARPPNLTILIRVEVLVTVSCALLAMLVFLSSGRQTSRSAAFRFLIWLALMLSYPVVSYTTGLIQSGPFRNDLVVVWACFFLSCADGIFTWSVDDSDQQARAILNKAVQVVYVFLLLLSYISSLDRQLKILLLLLWLLHVAKLGMLLWGLLSAGRDRVLTADNWVISNYMAHEYVRSTWDFHPETMKGYKYVVTGEKDAPDGGAQYTLEVTDDLVTVDRVWRQHEGRGSLLSKANGSSGKLMDLCLSFALFKLLRRRLSGKTPLHERNDIRTLLFARKGLAGGDHERMFRVIEVELGFLFDFFYARYQSPKLTLIPETVTFTTAVALSLSTLFSLRPQSRPGGESFVTTDIDIWLARCVIVLFLILELFQYLSLALSDWHKVKMLCRYVRKQSWQGHPVWERLMWLMCRARATPLPVRYWGNSVGQYSLLHTCLENELSCLTRMPLHKWIKGRLVQMRAVTRPGLPDSVKRAIHQLIQSEWLSNLKYGDRTLQRNNMLQDFDWSTSRYQYNVVGSILVWHIATAVCDAKHSKNSTDAIVDDREVATTLSNYCAYLLFQAPELVTDQVYDARRLMEALQLKLQQFLRSKRCRSKDDMFIELSGYQLQEAENIACEEAILADGIKLARQMWGKVPDEEAQWKVLSEMWVELLLTVAPSDNVAAHVKKLATGGELITHLWALLTHGGIIDKPARPDYRSNVCNTVPKFDTDIDTDTDTDTEST